MKNTIEHFDIIEGNLRAVKDTSDFGGPNMWRLHIKTLDNCWEDIDWSSHGKVQKFFSTKLPYYREAETRTKPVYTQVP